MADIFDKAKRSEIMKKVRSKNNKSTELKLIQIFKENNIHGSYTNGCRLFTSTEQECRY